MNKKDFCFNFGSTGYHCHMYCCTGHPGWKTKVLGVINFVLCKGAYFILEYLPVLALLLLNVMLIGIATIVKLFKPSEDAVA